MFNKILVISLLMLAFASMQCPNDETCMGCSLDRCTVCYYGYTNETGGCTYPVNKIENCFSYVDENNCMYCEAGYQLMDKKCVKNTIKNCMIPTPMMEDECSVCYGQQPDYKYKCEGDVPCEIENCEMCTNGGCFKCNDGYMVDLDGNCAQQEFGNCMYGYNGECKICSAGWYIYEGYCYELSYREEKDGGWSKFVTMLREGDSTENPMKPEGECKLMHWTELSKEKMMKWKKKMGKMKEHWKEKMDKHRGHWKKGGKHRDHCKGKWKRKMKKWKMKFKKKMMKWKKKWDNITDEERVICVEEWDRMLEKKWDSMSDDMKMMVMKKMEAHWEQRSDEEKAQWKEEWMKLPEEERQKLKEEWMNEFRDIKNKEGHKTDEDWAEEYNKKWEEEADRMEEDWERQKEEWKEENTRQSDKEEIEDWREDERDGSSKSSESHSDSDSDSDSKSSSDSSSDSDSDSSSEEEEHVGKGLRIVGAIIYPFTSIFFKLFTLF